MRFPNAYEAPIFALTVSSAFAFMSADAGAQVLDSNSPAVREAHPGPVISEKIQTPGRRREKSLQRANPGIPDDRQKNCRGDGACYIAPVLDNVN